MVVGVSLSEATTKAVKYQQAFEKEFQLLESYTGMLTNAISAQSYAEHQKAFQEEATKREQDFTNMLKAHGRTHVEIEEVKQVVRDVLDAQRAVVPRLDKLREEMTGIINAGHERVQAIGGIYCEAYS